MIQEYKPYFKKAILDITRRDIKDERILTFMEQGLKTKNKHCLVITENGKFKGYIFSYPVDKETIFVLHWVTKDKLSGVKLGLRYAKMIKKLGFKNIEYVRGDKYIRRKI